MDIFIRAAMICYSDLSVRCSSGVSKSLLFFGDQSRSSEAQTLPALVLTGLPDFRTPFPLASTALALPDSGLTHPDGRGDERGDVCCWIINSSSRTSSNTLPDTRAFLCDACMSGSTYTQACARTQEFHTAVACKNVSFFS